MNILGDCPDPSAFPGNALGVASGTEASPRLQLCWLKNGVPPKRGLDVKYTRRMVFGQPGDPLPEARKIPRLTLSPVDRQLIIDYLLRSPAGGGK